MKRKRVFLLAAFIAILLPACQNTSSQTGKDSTDNILQQDVGQAESGNVQEEVTVSSGEYNLSGTVPN